MALKYAQSASTHLLALIIGMAAVIIWPRGDQKAPAEDQDPTNSQNSAPRNTRSQPEAQPDPKHVWLWKMRKDLDREITASDLDAWIKSMGDDAESKAQALAAAGLLTNDPDLIRQAIAADSNR